MIININLKFLQQAKININFLRKKTWRKLAKKMAAYLLTQPTHESQILKEENEE
jgi:hypothetical protein